MTEKLHCAILYHYVASIWILFNPTTLLVILLCRSLLTCLETPQVPSWSCCAERRCTRHKKGTGTGQTPWKWFKCCWFFIQHCSTFILLWPCLPSQWRNSTAWLPSPTRLTPGKQTQWSSELSVGVWTTLLHFSQLNRNPKHSVVISICFSFVSPFRWSSSRARSSSLEPWRPASPPCSTRGRPSPRTRCSLQSLRFWCDHRPPAAGWRVWCPCGWSCDSALDEAEKTTCWMSPNFSTQL